MIHRENALDEIAQRITDAKVPLGLKGFRRTPTRPVDEKYLPCIFMIEGNDEITSHSARSALGYPSKRAMEVIIEVIAHKSTTDIKQLYRDVRSVVLKSNEYRGNVMADGATFILEIRTEGPVGYGLPDVIGMSLVLAMSYTDDGN